MTTHLYPPPAKFKALKSFLLASFTLFAAVIMASCEFWHQPVREYLETWTMEVAIEKYELFGVESYTDKDGNLCIPSGQDVPVTLFMRNPKHLAIDKNNDILKPETFPEIQPDAEDTTLLHFTYSSDYLKDFDGSENNEIGSTITMLHPNNRTQKEYTFSLKCNSKPPVIDDAAIMTSGTGDNQKYVLAITCPTLDKCKENTGIHRDIVSITINGVTYPVTPASNGELIFGDSLFTRTRPSSLNTINRNFDHSDLAVYFCPDEGASEESKNSKTYTITYTDRAGFTNTRTIDAKLPGMSNPLVYDNDNADSEAATLDENTVNILHIDSTENADHSTVTIKMPTVNDIGLPVIDKNPKIYWTLTDGSENPVEQNPSVANPGTVDVSLKIQREGEYTLTVYAGADAHTNSSVKTYRLKLEYAQLPPPVVKKTNETSLTAGSGSNTNNYIQVEINGKASVKLCVPNVDINGNGFLNAGNVTVHYNLLQGSTGEDPTDTSEQITSETPKYLTPGQWVITAVAKKPGYKDSAVVTYKVRAFNCNIYVKSASAEVNPGDDTSGDGSESKPYATITRAAEEIGNFNIPTNEYTIHVIGEVVGSHAINYIGGRASKITIQGEGNDATLKGSGTSTVLTNVVTSIPLYIKNLKITGGNGNLGGGIYNQGNITLQSGAVISGNSATNGGGIYINSGSLTIESGAEISGNSATYGGGIYVNSNSGTLTIKGGIIKSNTATSDGAAIYALKTFTVKQNAQIDSSNDVYLANGKYINIDGTLSKDNVAKITPGLKSGDTSPWHRGTQVLSGNVPENPAAKFSVTKTGWSVRKASSSSGKLDAPLYVSASGNDATNSGASASDAYATISTALSEIKNDSDSNRDFTINIVGTLTGNQIITGINGSAKSLTLEGTGDGGTLDAQNVNNTRPLTVSATVPVTIKKLTITGGKVANGGGIYINANATVKLADGATVTDNEASGNGGGVYVGSGAKLFMYGSSLIGDKSKTDHATNGAYANTVGTNGSGGGIYNAGGTVYLGYDDVNSPKAIDDGYGVRYNYAKFGGGIYNSGTVYLNTGNISYNGSGNNGGGIFNNSSSVVSISGGTIKENYSGSKGGGIINAGGSLTLSGGSMESNSANSDGGAVYNNNSGEFEMTGGIIGGSGKENTCGSSYNGGAIYNGNTFELGGTAQIPGGSGKANNIYLASNKTIDLKSPLTTFSPKAKISLETYKFNMQVVKPLTGITSSDIYNACSSLSLAYNPYLLDLGDDGYTTVGFYFCTETTDISNYPSVIWSTNAINTTAATNKRGNRALLIKINNNTYAIGQLHFEPLNDDGARPLTFNYRVVNSEGQVNYTLTDSSAYFGDGGVYSDDLSSDPTFGTPENYYFHIEFTSNTNCEFSLGNLAQGLYAIPQ